MGHYKSFYVSRGLILAVTFSLSSCAIYDQNNDKMTSPAASSFGYEQPIKSKAPKTTASSTVKKSVTTEPMQKTTPGPKRAAAPQLPVIQ